MSTAYAMDDEAPDINEPILMDDLSDQETSDVIDPVSRVPFIIKKASIRKQYADPNDKTSAAEVTRLVIDAAIDAAGTDGEGKFANKHLFSELIVAFNKETHTGDWWQKKARGPAKQLLQALGFDPSQPPAIDAEFLSELGGREFVADIRKRPIQNKTDQVNPTTGKAIYADSGEFKNELANFRAAA